MDFYMVDSAAVRRLIHGAPERCIDVVRRTYLAHRAGQTVNPPSVFLRFPDRPRDRIIALPAYVGSETRTSGVKWVSSYPGNHKAGLPRASSVLIVNREENGFPLGCLDGTIISAARTAASATLAASVLAPAVRSLERLGIVGTGIIAAYTYWFLSLGRSPWAEVRLFDTEDRRAACFRDRVLSPNDGLRTRMETSAATVCAGSDLVVFATTVGEPYICDTGAFAHAPLVLHLSLRDLAPEVILSAVNVVDDADHCFSHGTSLHLAEQRTGSRDCVAACLPDLLAGPELPRTGRAVVFSPFGMGILDVALGKAVLDEAVRLGWARRLEDFFDATTLESLPSLSTVVTRPAGVG